MVGVVPVEVELVPDPHPESMTILDVAITSGTQTLRMDFMGK
jgi:hypothetical protein